MKHIKTYITLALALSSLNLSATHTHTKISHPDIYTEVNPTSILGALQLIKDGLSSNNAFPAETYLHPLPELLRRLQLSIHIMPIDQVESLLFSLKGSLLAHTSTNTHSLNQEMRMLECIRIIVVLLHNIE